MWHPLDPVGYPAAQPALATMHQHLAVAALLAGRVPGTVWADDAQPALVVAQTTLHCFISGAQPTDVPTVHALFEQQILPAAQTTGQEGVVVHAPTVAWTAGLDEALRDLFPEQRPRQIYTRPLIPTESPATLPAGFTLRAVDAALLAETHLAGLDALRTEMCSERPTVASFLAESFGVCALAGDALAGWCLSEYNLDDRCEIGIATLPAYQRRGLAAALTQALLFMAARHSVRTVGWHCWTSNLASAATARRSGFTLADEEIVRLRLFR